ncbi:3-hydroxybutyrate dehydrogenase [Shewanella sp. D64]|uniref:3-hydroxybutyrate dehydrogenase n=1 Tax=unclassified Shewanella TaxID=196818 RepID=UPI0022BA526A|nr:MULTISPECIES: 3-hydroxybutyrate dehydrogenase [unclassified Shewanella]MEC4725158.1 3-hydroxybutyrate dehydrogenase [Shewanella sp. D64]MEC4737059.1 3-hydroxybutyrate dehydrogenase [Shewanella sp. E94]WBJ96644.1 3-hydroxybutyrate dehydrogenase [Shewanella sp. MTB7]
MLSGKVALITGSTSGIGLATAHVLAEQGINLVLHGLMTDVEGQALAADFAERYKIQTLFDNADLRDGDKIAAFMDSAIAKIGTIDILVNNAGIQHTQGVDSFPVNKWNDIIAINLSSAFHTIQKTLPGMRENRWGRIINIASVHGLVASVNKSAYCAAKHGIIGLTKVVALECAEQAITVNAICPGWVDTPLINHQISEIASQKQMSFDDAKYQLVTAKQPLPEMLAPRQIGEFVLFLCSDSAGGITGSSLPMDGAWTAQ